MLQPMVGLKKCGMIRSLQLWWFHPQPSRMNGRDSQTSITVTVNVGGNIILNLIAADKSSCVEINPEG